MRERVDDRLVDRRGDLVAVFLAKAGSGRDRVDNAPRLSKL
ncbi:MAG TPA: hypothetical protein VGV57_11705 [Thermoleophilaceae bacterium]|nr:hypothetical protein [Thermoleophilaceae bacterium]